MNRLEERFQKLAREGSKALIPYLMAGEPSWEAAAAVMAELESAGAAAVELGVPFSDPIADGPVIQAAAGRALARGVTLEQIFEQSARFRSHSALPLLLMGYWNVFLSFGREQTLRAAREAGVDGLIIADLPPEADPEFFELARQEELCTVLLASELTPLQRLHFLAEGTRGFLYYVPQLGTTGLSLRLDASLRGRLQLIKSLGPAPVCVGIGVKTREQVRELTQVADGVIVGTRIVQLIHEHREEPHLPRLVGSLVRSLLP
jgi:tryptophan synthase alpha chain